MWPFTAVTNAAKSRASPIHFMLTLLPDAKNVTACPIMLTEGDVLRLGPLGEWGPSPLDAADVGAATAAQGGLADTATQPGDLGNSAALDVGTATGTVAAGDDSRLTSLPTTYAARAQTVENAVIFNANAGLRKWRCALAGVQSTTTGIINVNVFNNSIGAGSYAGDFAHGWLALLQAKLTTMFEDVGIGCVPVYEYSYYPTFAWTFTGVWTAGAAWGFADSIKYTSEVGATATLTFNGTGLVVLAPVTGSGATFTVAIDGLVRSTATRSIGLGFAPTTT